MPRQPLEVSLTHLDIQVVLSVDHVDMYLLHASAFKDQEQGDICLEQVHLAQDVVAENHGSLKLVQLWALLAQVQFSLPVGTVLVNFFNRDHANRLVLPILDLCVILRN